MTFEVAWGLHGTPGVTEGVSLGTECLHAAGPPGHEPE